MRRIRNMTVDPVQITLDGGGRRDNNKPVRIQPRDGYIGFYPAITIEELCIDNFACLNGNIITGNFLQHGFCVFAHHHDLAKTGHIKHANMIANGAMFGGIICKPVLPFP